MNGMNPVLVRVRGTQRDDMGKTDTIESMTAGRHSVKNSKHYVRYDDELLHEQRKTSTVLKFSGDELVILRRGGVEQELRFREGADTRCRCRTPYGSLDMSIRTSRLAVRYGLTEGVIEAEYEIAINGQYQSTNTLRVEITEDKKKKEG